jgi:hypothetical protein
MDGFPVARTTVDDVDKVPGMSQSSEGGFGDQRHSGHSEHGRMNACSSATCYTLRHRCMRPPLAFCVFALSENIESEIKRVRGITC